MSETALARKRIDITIAFADGGFGAQGAPSLTLTGHCVACHILSTGLETGMMCRLRVQGMDLQTMNRLSVAQAGVVAQGLNTVAVMAGDDGTVLPLVFAGGITEAFVDYNTAPDIAFEIQALSTAIPAAAPVAPTSFNADVAVSVVMGALAAKAGLGFANNGVDTALAGGVYYKGAALEQIDACARAANITYHIGMGLLSIWPYAVPAQAGGQDVPEISAATGLIGYPSYSQYGVGFRSVFTPSIGFRDLVRLDSPYSPAAWANGAGQVGSVAGGGILPPSNGVWVVQSVAHDLQSETPGGAWTTTVEAARPSLAGQNFAQ
ncbi:hypothetical protein K2X14_10240 [Acetobacter sp. TBRC 12305]|uniref:Uncharacterized protein n=1 Tax=Acetobacter garciniae TaxID=2817435 RepID=A0A939HQX2_9PROT|nr:hypothetical protein [Acetobacter garciniae]MBO1326044.1 hypothetical protein [Acetobacter garciniae]MBX0345212.1 hypothetical protein [Acetobacter garciniae]